MTLTGCRPFYTVQYRCCQDDINFCYFSNVLDRQFGLKFASSTYESWSKNIHLPKLYVSRAI